MKYQIVATEVEAFRVELLGEPTPVGMVPVEFEHEKVDVPERADDEAAWLEAVRENDKRARENTELLPDGSEVDVGDYIVRHYGADCVVDGRFFESIIEKPKEPKEKKAKGKDKHWYQAKEEE